MLSEDKRRMLARVLADDLAGGSMQAIGPGGLEATVPIEAITLDANSHIHVVATFGERDGNFDWTERRILDASGQVADSDPGDHGRKVMGAQWVVEAIIELESLNG